MPCRYNAGLLEFHKSLQETGDTDDHWFDIDPMENEDLPTTFKVRNYLRITFHLWLIRIIFDKLQFMLTMSFCSKHILLLGISFLYEKQP